MSSHPHKSGRGRRRHGRGGRRFERGNAGPANLSSMEVGERGTVLSLFGCRGLRRRLMEMGLIEGSSLRVVKFAPGGDPIEIQVNDYFLSLRRREADHIIVDVRQPRCVD